jgi:hypothetical protein
VQRGALRELRIRPRVRELTIVCAWDGTREPPPPLQLLLDVLRPARRSR